MAHKSELPAIDQLAATPDVMRMVLDGITETEASTKPPSGGWSIAEVLEHLSHTEGYLYRTRAELIVNENNPNLESYDHEAFDREGQYSGGDAEDSFAHWEEQREANIEFLRSLSLAAGSRTGIHEKLGEVTLDQVLHEWAFHDLGHLRQVIEVVRTVRYLPKLGPFQQS